MEGDLFERLNDLDRRIVAHSEQVQPDDYDLSVDITKRRTHGYLMDVLVALDVAESNYRAELNKDLPQIERFTEIENRLFKRLGEIGKIKEIYNGNIEDRR